jgi:D-3-phosphoglycerate dehydrogenase
MSVLVCEKIGDSGVELLRSSGFEVELGIDWDRDKLVENVGRFDGLLIRSATTVDAELLERATKLKVVGRAGVGVDNVDVEDATKHGVIVANAPESNVVTAAEHTMALLLSLARNVPQAHGALTEGRWGRSQHSGVELLDKTLGILGFGRIGQLVAARAQAFGMKVLAFDPFIGSERYRELGVTQAASPEELYAESDFITLHLPKTPETEGWLNAEAFAQMKDGVRILNVARGPLIVDEDLQQALDSGKVAGAALDVFQSEPMTEHPLFSYPNVIVTPHLGASTSEATDRAGYQAAEQVVAALSGKGVTSAVNVPSVAPEDLEVLGPFLPLCHHLGKLVSALAGGAAVDRIEVEYFGRIAERDCRPLTTSVLLGLLEGRTEESVNEVNAPSIVAKRGIVVSETSRTSARDFTELVRVTQISGDERTRVVGTTLGRRHRPHLLELWDRRFNLQLHEHLVLFQYEDVPGMIGHVGVVLGQNGINIENAAVGYDPDGEDDAAPAKRAVMVLTTSTPVPPEVVAQIEENPGIVTGRAVSLD